MSKMGEVTGQLSILTVLICFVSFSYCFNLLFKIDLTIFDKEYLNTLREKAVQSLKQAHSLVELSIDVHYTNVSSDNHIKEYLSKTHTSGNGHYTRMRRRRNTVYYYCERAGKPRGSSTGLSYKTRANGCTAYISFQFFPRGNKTACVIKYNFEHKGHSLDLQPDKHVNKIHPYILNMVEVMTLAGTKRSSILMACKQWSDEQQQSNMHDRRYYPSPADVKYHMEKTRKKHNLKGPSRKARQSSGISNHDGVLK